MGDFRAHYESRDKGIVTQKLRDFFRYLELRCMQPNEPGKKPVFKQIRPVGLPADFPQIIRSRFRSLDPKEIKRVTGLKLGPATKVLNDLLKNFYKDKDDTHFLQFRHTLVENKLLFLCLNSLMPKAVFTQRGVWNDFCMVLTKNNLLQKGEEKLLKPMEPPFMLYLMKIMHQCEIPLVSGKIATLNAGATMKDDKMYVGATGDWIVPELQGRAVAVVPVFDLDLKASEWCEPGFQPDRFRNFPGPIEISSNLKLCAL